MKTILGRRYLPHAFPLEVLHCVHVERPSTLVMHSTILRNLPLYSPVSRSPCTASPTAQLFLSAVARTNFLVNNWGKHTFSFAGRTANGGKHSVRSTILRGIFLYR